mgnify:CR=1 FL=1
MNNLNGILLVIGAMAAFTLEDALIKQLSDWFPTGQILIILGLGAGGIFAALALATRQPLFSRRAWRPASLLRALSEAVAATAFVIALSLVDISVVAAVFQATPLAITMGAALVFGEQVGWRRWSAIFIGFAGVLLIIRPGLEGFEPAAALVLVSVAGVVVRDLSTRVISSDVSSLVVSFQGFASLILSGAILLWLQGAEPVRPTPAQVCLIAGTLVFSVTGYYAIVRAMRVADASALQPFRYTRLVFSIIAGVDPKIGLYASFSIAVITAIVGGRPGMISAATAATAVLMVTLVRDHGLQYLLAATILAGVLQVAAGLLKLGSVMRFVSRSVMTGFVNALAILIFMAQLPELIGVPWLTYVMVAAGLAIIYLFPYVTTAIPSPLVCIIALTAVALAFGMDLRTVGDMGDLPDTLPVFLLPDIPLNMETLMIILPYSAAVAAVGLLESLMTAQIVDDLTDTTSDKNQECIGQGVANFCTGFIGGMAGCAMIGQSMINVKSGGRTRIAAVAAALFLLVFILYAAPLIELIPLAALVGVMFMVVIGTFAWNSFKILRRVPLTDAVVIVLVTVVTVFEDLATAVVFGVIVSALAYAWNNARRIHARSHYTPEGARVYSVQGPLFFGSSDGFVELFDPEGDPGTVIVDFADSRVVDQSALQAIETVAAKYEAQGKRIVLRHLSRDCHRLLKKAGHLMVDSDDDPDYGLAVNYGVRTGILGGH